MYKRTIANKNNNKQQSSKIITQEFVVVIVARLFIQVINFIDYLYKRKQKISIFCCCCFRFWLVGLLFLKSFFFTTISYINSRVFPIFFGSFVKKKQK